MMPPHLFVISFLRFGQMILTGFLYMKVYKFKVSSVIDIYCRSTLSGQIKYDIEYPFAWLPVTAPSDCSNEPTNATTYIWTGFGPTAYLFTGLVFTTFVYGVLAIAFYYNRHPLYDAKKTFPAVDLLLSLIMGAFWVLDCYLAWTNYPDLKREGAAEKVLSGLSICNDSGGYCSTVSSGEFGDVNSFLFLGLACALSWGISVWFIFMESGLCPEDEEEFATYSDLEYDREIHGLPPTIPPFYDVDNQMTAKDPAYRTEYGFDGNNAVAGNQLDPKDTVLLELQQQQFLEYLNNWKNHGSSGLSGSFDQDYDRFARGLTFGPPPPPVATISNKQLDNDVPEIKMHTKWNLFKA